MGKGMLAFLAAMTVTGVACAQGAGNATVGGSKLLKVLFGYPAVAVVDDGFFRQTLDAVANLDGRKCGTLEAFGWTYDSVDKGRAVVDATMDAVQKAGFGVKPLDIKQFEGRQVFVSALTHDKQKFVMIWTPQADAATMVLCETVKK